MANEASERPFLEACDVPAAAIVACSNYLKFCELGVIGPDLPFLCVPPSESQKWWGDAMHYQKTDGVIRAAIERLRDHPIAEDDRQKSLAWLLGYTAHVVMDCTLHPVVNLRVGPYATNQKGHRICEMNQDVFIFDRLDLSVRYSEHLKNGIARCVVDGTLDPCIVDLWSGALAALHPQQFATAAPSPADWHRWFVRIVGTLGSGTNLLVALARHVVPGQGLVYPTYDQIDQSYIRNLRTPDGRTMDFDALFILAKRNVGKMWRVVTRGVLGLDREYETVLEHGNLDTGLNAQDQLIYWPGP
jgi:hypothetical protein